MKNEELIISSYLIEGQGTAAELISIRDRIFDNAVTSVNRAANHPDLVIKQPLRENTNICQI